MIYSVYREEFPQIFYFIDENKIGLKYNPSQRSFSILSQDGFYSQEINFCPWTGKSLPPSLSERFSEMLESKDLSILEPSNWPEIYKDETWWLELGL